MRAIDNTTLDQLTRELGWIRGLARALVSRDADDLAHEAWLVAREQAPVDRPLRPWLVRMMTNLARMRGRGASRRDARDLRAEPPPPVPNPQQLVERVELGRVVAEEVVALAEPYRSTILLHFYEGLSSAEIARRLELPDGTVRRRLKVGLDQLRERLRDRRDPPSSGWLAALIPLAGPPGVGLPIGVAGARATKATTASVTTSSTAGATLAVVAVVIVIAGGIAWQLAHGDSDSSGESTAPPIARVYSAAAPRDPSAPPAAGSLIFGQPGAPARRLGGIVTANGAPIPNAAVHLAVELVRGPDGQVGKLAGVAHVVTDASGHFDFGEQAAAHYVMTAQATDHAPAWTPVEAANPTIPVDAIEIALGPCTATVTGRVHDAQGTGLVAHVETRELATVDTSPQGDFTSCTTADPTLLVSSDGYAATSRLIAGSGDLHVDITLVPGASASGRVVDQLDHPVASARVAASPVPYGTADAAADRWVASDGDGRFELDQLATGRWYVRATAGDAGAASDMIVTVEPGTVVGDVRLVVTPRVHVRGRVTLDGQPFAGAGIESYDLSFHAYSQRDGTFEVAGIVPGRIGMHVVGFLLEESNFIVDGTRDLELRLVRHAHITGRVTSNGAACGEVDVDCPDYPQTTTDASGAYTCVSPAWERGMQTRSISARKSCRGSPEHRTSRELRMWPNTAATIDMQLDVCECPAPEPPRYPPPPPPTPCRGSVMSTSGEGVPHAQVRLGEHTTTTTATGTFTLDSCEVPYDSPSPSPVVLGRRDAQAPYPLVSFTGDGNTTPYAITVDTTALTIHGRVLGVDRKPVVDARVTLTGTIGMRGPSGDDAFAATTLADGRFSIGPVPTFAHYNLTASVGTLRGEVHEVSGDTDIIVGGNGSIHGDLDGDWDSPTVIVRSLLPPHDEHAASVDDSELDLADVAPGLYEVIAYDNLVERRSTAIVQSGKVAHVGLSGHNKLSPAHARLVDHAKHTPIAGMACQTGTRSRVLAGDDNGTVVSSTTETITCWSSRGPAQPISVFLHPDDCGQCDAPDDQLVQLVRPGSVQPGFIVAPLSSPPTVAVVDAAGPATNAGLESGDVIVELDGAGVAQLSPQDVMYLVWSHPRGPLRLGVRRDGSIHTIVVSLP